MLKKIKELIKENRRNQKNIINYSRELNWADVFHDSIRGKEWLQSLPLNVGRWAGNYGFFYVLNRVLSEYKPKTILELGLGESTKFISAFLENELYETVHLVIEEDENWKEHFLSKNELSTRTNIVLFPVKQKKIRGIETNIYSNLHNSLSIKYELYLIDGPKGSSGISRYDMVILAEKIESKDDFLFIIDDYERLGEQESVKELLSILERKKIEIYSTVYYSLKKFILIGSKKYIHTRSF